ncbi:DUF6641 family protein [Polynucleobacter sinensis]|uniref:DUF6641 family protein n=1 Tax=Polynucleobacter sinensis TaxID=1743157 RepID=UPI000786254A|nr:DUF6641 family protein [Polynucleobacter sinensis]
MSVLAELQLTTSKRAIKVSPIVARRRKLASKLHEQLELCEAKKNGQIYAPKKLRTYVNKQTGERMTVEAIKRIKEWHWTASDGLIHLSVKYGSKVLPLAADGSNAIVCANTDALIETLKTLKLAVLDGELDTAITEVSNFTKSSFAK